MELNSKVSRTKFEDLQIGLEKYALKTKVIRIADEVIQKASAETVRQHEAKLRAQEEILTALRNEGLAGQQELSRMNETILLMREQNSIVFEKHHNSVVQLSEETHKHFQEVKLVLESFKEDRELEEKYLQKVLATFVTNEQMLKVQKQLAGLATNSDLSSFVLRMDTFLSQAER